MELPIDDPAPYTVAQLEEKDISWVATPAMPETDRQAVIEAVGDHHLEFWEVPSDGADRTKTALSYDDTLTLLPVCDGKVLGYDSSFPLDDDRAEEMYNGNVADMIGRTGEDVMMVYHMVIAPEHRGNGYGIATAYLRQSLLESGWEQETASDLYEEFNSGHTVTFEEDVFDTVADMYDTDTVLSFPRRYACEEDKATDKVSRAYRIAEGYGFAEVADVSTPDEPLIQKKDSGQYVKEPLEIPAENS